MMNIRQRSVNVNRLELINKLITNRDLHAEEYEQLLVEFRERLVKDLQLATKKVKKTTDTKDLKDFQFDVRFPTNHVKDFDEVIDMLQHSVDETINLDSESFKAYYHNEWAWSNSLKNLKALYAGSSFIS